MDMTKWIEYFTRGLSEQMKEIKSRGEYVIKLDVLAKKYNLSKRQEAALKIILENGHLTMKEYEELYPNLNRRTLQRELKEMIDKEILISEGATHHLIYRLSKFL